MEPRDPVLQTARLRLEPLTVEHAAEVFETMRDPRLYEFVPHAPPENLSELETRFRRLTVRGSPCRDEQWLNWILRLRSTNACIGRVEATVRLDHRAFLAYELGTAHQGQGLATEACAAMIAHLFETYPLDELAAEIDTRNEPSRRLLERLGFRRTGRRDHADHFKGAPSHEFTYVLARADAAPLGTRAPAPAS